MKRFRDTRVRPRLRAGNDAERQMLAAMNGAKQRLMDEAKMPSAVGPISEVRRAVRAAIRSK